MENPVTAKSTPRDVFMYLLVTATLYASVVAFIVLWLAYIDVLVPDQLGFCYTCSLDQIRGSSSVLLVVFPVFAFIFRLLRKEYQSLPQKRELRARKWLMYFTLFLAAVTIIVDLITLIFNFYSGELTLRFLLKTLVVLAVASAVFGYYVWDIRKGAGGSKARIITWLTSLVVLASIVGGFFVIGSPSVQRDRRFDERRVNDLQIIQNEVVNYWTQKGRLPTALADLKNSISGFVPPTDPQTGSDYSYRVNGSLKFELCAIFKTDGKDYYQNQALPKSVRPYDGPYQQNWDHSSGRVCFERTIDPDLYRKEKPTL